MRLIFNILFGMSLLLNACEVLASSVSVKSNMQKQYTNDKFLNSGGDVWERIRFGMKIPSPISSQVLTKSTQIPEKNSLVPKSVLLGKMSESGKMIGENTTSAQSVTSKYIKLPSKAIAPENNYTALGLRLRFGTKTPSAINENCTPLISTVKLQEHVPRFKNYGAAGSEILANKSFKSQLSNHAVSADSGSDKIHVASNDTAEKSDPCNKISDKQVVGVVSKQPKQSEVGEKLNDKKSLINERINKQIAFFSQSPGYLYQVAERARPYLYHIVEGLNTNQLPLELALLPIVESGYQPTAFSPKGAAGLWQFIPSTGKDYDLKQSNHYDERLDIVSSTRAAIRFLSDLKGHFKGDWLLALAAYNCGQGAVDKAISRNLAEGLEADYWSLRLPEETQDYVPRLLALSNIFAHPDNYGLKFIPIKNEPYFVKVKINREVDIRYLTDKKFAVLAKLSNLSHEQFSRLNPGYLNPAVSAEGAYTFLLPLANADQLHRLLTSVAQFMSEPVSLAMNNKKPEYNAFPNAWDLSPGTSSIKLIRSSLLSKEIY